MEGKIQKRLVLAALLLLAASVHSSAQTRNQEQRDSLVRLMKAESVELIEKAGHKYRKTIDATFLHNGTFLVSDTALWNLDRKIINAWGNVQLIQDETVLTSEKLDYLIDEDLAQFRGQTVQLRNRKENILRTRNLDYNTRDSIAVFRGGASMRDKDGQIIESLEGTYDSAKELFTFKTQVNMFTDSIFVRTSLLEYDSARNKADFPVYIDFWKDGNMLSAGSGWYDRNRETFFFKSKVHGLSEQQEAWCDSLYFYRVPQDILMLGNAQLQDSSRHVAGLAGRIFYQDSLALVTMTREAAVALETKQQEKTDTLYMGGDKLQYWTIPMCDIPESEVAASKTRLEEISTDPVTEYRQKAAKAAAESAAKAREEAEKNDLNLAGAAAAKAKAEAGKNGPAAPGPGGPGGAPAAPGGAQGPAASDAAAAPSAMPETPAVPADSLSVPKDSLSVPGDSLAVSADSLALQQDSVVVEPPKDTTKIGFALALGHVKVFRKDLQVKCDSLRYCDLDSIARLYRDPVVWNDGNRQYTSDSLSVLVRNGGMDRASLMSNAFIITQEDTLLFDQIKGAEVMAYFDSDSQLKRFDALGGANALFYLKEKDAFATVNKVETKMLSALMKNGDVDKVFYFESPKNDAYPIVQLPKNEKLMKGFNWQPKNRPRGPRDITGLKVKKTERRYYESRPRASFKYTDIYFPGYMADVYAAIDSAKARKARIDRQKAAAEEESHAADSALLERVALSDTLAVSDTASALRSAGDSLSVRADSLALSDSLSAGADSLSTAADSLAAVPREPTQKEIRAAERKARQEAAELARQMRIARRDARWAELDARDAAKAAAKAQKQLERKRAKTLKALKFKQKEEQADARKLQKYIERYEKQKARKDERRRKKESLPSGERPQAVEAGRELQADPEPGPETAGGHAVLSDDGLIDDGAVQRGGGVSGS